MDFRQIIHSACRSAAAAARPSHLASITRLSPSAVLLQHQHHQQHFSTSRRLLSTPADEPPQPTTTSGPSAAHQQQQPSGGSTPPTHSALSGQTNLPPRPPPIRQNNLFMSPRGRVVDTATASSATATATASSAPGARAPWTSSSADPYQFPSQIQADMEKSTGAGTGAGAGASSSLLSPFVEDDFLKQHFAAPEGDPRLRPSTGRTVRLRAGIDVARAFHMLDRTVARNGLRKMVRLQREHERPGLKRKRLRSERWRARFKEGMRAVINRTMELRAQGW